MLARFYLFIKYPHIPSQSNKTKQQWTGTCSRVNNHPICATDIDPRFRAPLTAMITKILQLFGGSGFKARALRSAFLTLGSTFGANGLRLVSNLILTRLLFPEAFGMMAIVQIFLAGLAMFSDIGIRVSVIQNERQDADFLNTAWSIQIIRGLILWLGTCALAWPVATFYEEPQLLYLLPVAGLTAVGEGFRSTKVYMADRNLEMGMLTAITLGAQAASIILMVLLAWMFQSVWALAIGGVLNTLIVIPLGHKLLSGVDNRWCWEKSAVKELLNFGQFIFVSTMAGFLINNADRAILGKYTSLAELAVYNIGFFLASFPTMLSNMLVNKVVLPIYSAKRPTQDAGNKAKIDQVRMMLSSGTFLLTGLMAFGGDMLIRVLYDERYYDAGPILVLISLSALPTSITNSYSNLLLAEGNSKDFAKLIITTAVVKLTVMVVGLMYFGIFGVVIAAAISTILTYPMLVYFLRRYNGWDPRHDVIFAALAVVISIGAYWFNHDVLNEFISASIANAHWRL